MTTSDWLTFYLVLSVRHSVKQGPAFPLFVSTTK